MSKKCDACKTYAVNRNSNYCFGCKRLICPHCAAKTQVRGPHKVADHKKR